jgi:hypothetical protein
MQYIYIYSYIERKRETETDEFFSKVFNNCLFNFSISLHSLFQLFYFIYSVLLRCFLNIFYSKLALILLYLKTYMI